MQRRQLVKTVAVLPAFQHEGEQQRVVDRRRLDAVAIEDLHVVLDVMADLEDRGILQQRLQQLDRGLEGNLLEVGGFAAGVAEIEPLLRRAVGERNVAGDARRQSHGDADEIRPDRVEGIGLGVDRHRALGDRPGNPVFEGPGVLHQLVVVLGIGEVGRNRHRHMAVRGGLRRCCRGRRSRGGGRRRSSAGITLELAVDAIEEGAEVLRLQERRDLRAVERLGLQHLEGQRQRRVHVEGDQLLGDAGLLGEVDQVLPPLRLLDVARMGQQVLQRAVDADELGRGLDADPRHAGHVVDAVAGERLHVDHLLGPDTELLLHLGGADRPVLDRIEELHLVGDELHQVLVRGDDGDGGARLHRRLGIGGDEVVGLVVVALDARHREGVGRLAHQCELRDQVVGRRRPVRLVGLVDAAAEGEARGIEHHGDMVGVGLLQQLQQHVGETENGAYGRTVRPRQRRQRVIGPEDEARAVDEVDVLERLQGLEAAAPRGGALAAAPRFDSWI